jgi:transcriptional regulator with XRE-family HTH domain
MLGGYIKEIREEKGLSKDELSRLSGVHVNSIHRIESNKGSPSVCIVEKILDAMGYEIEIVSK